MSAYGYCYNNPVNLIDPNGQEGKHIDPPGYKKYKNIFLDLSRRSTIYAIEEILRKNKNGNAMSVPPDMRNYKRTKINEGTDINAPIVYVTEEISGWSFVGNDYSYRKLSGDFKIFEIDFPSNSNNVVNKNVFESIAENLPKSDGVINIQAQTQNPEGSSTGE